MKSDRSVVVLHFGLDRTIGFQASAVMFSLDFANCSSVQFTHCEQTLSVRSFRPIVERSENKAVVDSRLRPAGEIWTCNLPIATQKCRNYLYDKS